MSTMKISGFIQEETGCLVEAIDPGTEQCIYPSKGKNAVRGLQARNKRCLIGTLVYVPCVPINFQDGARHAGRALANYSVVP